MGDGTLAVRAGRAHFESFAWTSVAASVTLVQSRPLFVASGAPLVLNEVIGRRRAAGILVAVLGMAAMSAGDLLAGATVQGPRPLYGNALAVLGTLMAAMVVSLGQPRSNSDIPLSCSSTTAVDAWSAATVPDVGNRLDEQSCRG